MGATKMLTSQRVIRGMSGFLIINIIAGLLMDNNLLMPKMACPKHSLFQNTGVVSKASNLALGMCSESDP